MRTPLLIVACILAGCGSDDQRPTRFSADPDEQFDELATSNTSALCHEVPALRLQPLHVTSSRGGEACLANAEIAHDQDPRHLTTLCQGTTCFCLIDDVPYCTCETEGLWCEEPIPSCCPDPFP